MRILQVHTEYRHAGGEDRVVAVERDALSKAGHAVGVHLASNPTGLVETTIRFSAAAWNRAAARRVAVAVDEFDPDVVHVHNTWFSLSPAIFRVIDRPIAMTLHNYRLMCVSGLLYRDGSVCTDCVGSTPMNGVRHSCYRSSMAASAMAAATLGLHRATGTYRDHIDRFVALTEFSRSLHIQGGIEPTAITVKPNFVPDPGDRTLNPSESDTVVFVGRIAAEKGLPLVLDAWRRLAPQRLKLRIIGDGPLLDRLRKSHPDVEFSGRVTTQEVARAMRTSRAMVFPSLWFEGQPMVLLEAMAAGLPVLASDLGAIPEILDQQVRAASPAPHVEAWKSALEMLDDGDWLDRESRRFRARYESEFSERVGLNRLERLYADLIR